MAKNGPQSSANKLQVCRQIKVWRFYRGEECPAAAVCLEIPAYGVQVQVCKCASVKGLKVELLEVLVEVLVRLLVADITSHLQPIA